MFIKISDKESRFIRETVKIVIKILSKENVSHTELCNQLTNLGIHCIYLFEGGTADRHYNHFIPELLYYKTHKSGVDLPYFFENLDSYYFTITENSVFPTYFYQVYIHDVSKFYKKRYKIQWYKSIDDAILSNYFDSDDICHFNEFSASDSINEMIINKKLFSRERCIMNCGRLLV